LESPELGISFLGLAAVAAFILTNAYFVATEFSLVAVRRTQVDLWVADGRRGAKSAALAIQHLDDAIAATQLGITLASIGLGWIGEPAIAGVVEPLVRWFGFGSSFAVHGVAVAIAFAFITFLHVVLGELAPKAVALDRPGPVVLACARPLLAFAAVFRPILKVMNGAGNAVVRGFGIQPAGQSGSVHSSEELLMLVDEARNAGEIRPYAGRILGNVFRLSKTRVRDVMVPRAERSIRISIPRNCSTCCANMDTPGCQSIRATSIGSSGSSTPRISFTYSRGKESSFSRTPFGPPWRFPSPCPSWMH